MQSHKFHRLLPTLAQILISQSTQRTPGNKKILFSLCSSVSSVANFRFPEDWKENTVGQVKPGRAVILVASG